MRPDRVMACLRAHRQAGPGVADAIAELMLEACDVVHPPFFALFAERAERRLRVLKLEREAEVTDLDIDAAIAQFDKDVSPQYRGLLEAEPDDADTP